jgi:hypothetical protein
MALQSGPTHSSHRLGGAADVDLDIPSLRRYIPRGIELNHSIFTAASFTAQVWTYEWTSHTKSCE